MQLILGRNLNRLVERTIDRTVSGVHPMHALDGFSRFRRCRQVIDHVNAPDHQHVIFRLDLASDFRRQVLIARIYLTRLQRAPKGADQSTSGSGDDVIERRRVRLGDLRADFVVLGDGSVHAEPHRFSFSRQISEARRTGFALDPYMRNVSYA